MLELFVSRIKGLARYHTAYLTIFRLHQAHVNAIVRGVLHYHLHQGQWKDDICIIQDSEGFLAEPKISPAQPIILLHVCEEHDPCLAKAYQKSVGKPGILA